MSESTQQGGKKRAGSSLSVSGRGGGDGDDDDEEDDSFVIRTEKGDDEQGGGDPFCSHELLKAAARVDSMTVLRLIRIASSNLSSPFSLSSPSSPSPSSPSPSSPSPSPFSSPFSSPSPFCPPQKEGKPKTAPQLRPEGVGVGQSDESEECSRSTTPYQDDEDDEGTSTHRKSKTNIFHVLCQHNQWMLLKAVVRLIRESTGERIPSPVPPKRKKGGKRARDSKEGARGMATPSLSLSERTPVRPKHQQPSSKQGERNGSGDGDDLFADIGDLDLGDVYRPTQDKDDIFADFDDSDLEKGFGGEGGVSGGGGQADEDDIFAGIDDETQPSAAPPPTQDEEDIFAGIDDDEPSSAPTTTKQIEEEEEDIFAGIDDEPTASGLPQQLQEEEEDIFAGIDDDDETLPSLQQQKEEKEDEEEDIFAGIDDEPTGTSFPQQQQLQQEEEEDDIFAGIDDEPPETGQQQQLKQEEEDDIFAGIDDEAVSSGGALVGLGVQSAENDDDVFAAFEQIDKDQGASAQPDLGLDLDLDGLDDLDGFEGHSIEVIELPIDPISPTPPPTTTITTAATPSSQPISNSKREGQEENNECDEEDGYDEDDDWRYSQAFPERRPIESVLGLINAKDTKGITPLHYACLSGSLMCARILLSIGADPTCICGLDGLLPFQQLMSRRYDDRIPLYHSVCLQFFACFPFPQLAVNQRSETFLHSACIHNREQIARFLVHSGADPNALSALDESPLGIATRSGHCSLVQLLLQFGGNPSARCIPAAVEGGESMTAAQMAVLLNCRMCVSLFKAKTNKDNGGDSSSQPPAFSSKASLHIPPPFLSGRYLVGDLLYDNRQNIEDVREDTESGDISEMESEGRESNKLTNSDVSECELAMERRRSIVVRPQEKNAGITTEQPRGEGNTEDFDTRSEGKSSLTEEDEATTSSVGKFTVFEESAAGVCWIRDIFIALEEERHQREKPGTKKSKKKGQAGASDNVRTWKKMSSDFDGEYSYRNFITSRMRNTNQNWKRRLKGASSTTPSGGGGGSISINSASAPVPITPSGGEKVGGVSSSGGSGGSGGSAGSSSGNVVSSTRVETKIDLAIESWAGGSLSSGPGSSTTVSTPSLPVKIESPRAKEPKEQKIDRVIDQWSGSSSGSDRGSGPSGGVDFDPSHRPFIGRMIPKRRGDLSSDDDKLSLDLSSKGSRNDDSFGFTPRNSKRSSLNPKAGIAGLAGVGLGGGEKKVGGIGTSKLASGGRSEVEFDEPDQKFGHRLGFDLYSGQQVLIRTYSDVSRSFVRLLQLELCFRQNKMSKMRLEEEARRRLDLDPHHEDDQTDSLLQCCQECDECRNCECDLSFPFVGGGEGRKKQKGREKERERGKEKEREEGRESEESDLEGEDVGVKREGGGAKKRNVTNFEEESGGEGTGQQQQQHHHHHHQHYYYQQQQRVCCRHSLSGGGGGGVFGVYDHLVEWLDVVVESSLNGIAAHIIMVYVPRMQKLWNFLRNIPDFHFTENETRNLVRQLVGAVSHIHNLSAFNKEKLGKYFPYLQPRNLYVVPGPRTTSSSWRSALQLKVGRLGYCSFSSRYLGASLSPFGEEMEGKIVSIQVPFNLSFQMGSGGNSTRIGNQISPLGTATPANMFFLPPHATTNLYPWLERFSFVSSEGKASNSFSTFLLNKSLLPDHIASPPPTKGTARLHSLFPLAPFYSSQPISYCLLTVPEVIDPNLRACTFGQLVDVWTIGLCIFIWISGTFPHQIETTSFESTDVATFANLMTTKKQEGGSTGGGGTGSSGLLYLLQKMLCPNPFDRISLSELESSEWVNVYGEDSDSESASFSSHTSPSPTLFLTPSLESKANKGKKKKRRMDKQF